MFENFEFTRSRGFHCRHGAWVSQLKIVIIDHTLGIFRETQVFEKNSKFVITKDVGPGFDDD